MSADAVFLVWKCIEMFAKAFLIFAEFHVVLGDINCQFGYHL